MRVTIACLATLLLAGCATTPGEDRLAEGDPLEGFNRGVWGVNQALDKVAVKPATTVYRAVTPPPARRGLSRIFANLSEPLSMVNNLLQGNPDRAARNLGRFIVNSTIGVGGLADHATGFGIAPAEEDFGQTLGKWGVNGGPYLVLPLLGPSTLRDGVGFGIGQIADPYNIGLRESGLSTSQQWGVKAASVIDVRSSLIDSGADTFLETSLDPYAAARSAYLQRRHAAIRNEEENGDAAPDASVSEMEDASPDASLATDAPADASESIPENQ